MYGRLSDNTWATTSGDVGAGWGWLVMCAVYGLKSVDKNGLTRV